MAVGFQQHQLEFEGASSGSYFRIITPLSHPSCNICNSRTSGLCQHRICELGSWPSMWETWATCEAPRNALTRNVLASDRSGDVCKRKPVAPMAKGCNLPWAVERRLGQCWHLHEGATRQAWSRCGSMLGVRPLGIPTQCRGPTHLQ